MAGLSKACVELHYKPGINPHSGTKTKEIERIEVTDFRVAKLVSGGAQWWTTPGLKSSKKKGADVLFWKDCLGEGWRVTKKGQVRKV